MTLLGKPTVAELKDLLAAKDYTIGQLDRAYADFAPTWVARDSAAFTDWTSDWNAFHKRYDTARTAAQRAIDFAKLNVAPESLLVAEDEYGAVLKALKQIDGTITKGDLQDLYDRIAGAGKTPDLSRTPQPAATDMDLRAYSAADRTLKAVEAVGKAAAKPAASLFTPRTVLLGFLCVGLIAGVAAAARRVLP
jgi:hypothetical protein